MNYKIFYDNKNIDSKKILTQIDRLLVNSSVEKERAPFKKYKCVLFDLDNTILDYFKSQKETVEEVLSSFNLRYENFYKTYKIISKKLWHNLGSKRLRDYNIQCWKHSLKRFSYSNDNFSEFSDKYKRCFSEKAYFLGCSKEILLELKKYFKLGLISSGNPEIQNKRLSKVKIGRLFDAVAISGDRKRKPNLSAFKKLLKKLKANPQDCIMIGDSIEEDFIPAQKLKIDFCLINNKAASFQSHAKKPLYKERNIKSFYKKLINLHAEKI